MNRQRQRVFTIGLTGGIASGKTTVSDTFQALGADVIDADVAARAVVEPGEPGLQELVERFGPDILQADGSLDRTALRRQIFQEPSARKEVEAILHPRIRDWIRDRLASSPGPYAVLVVPLLVEGGREGLVRMVDRVLVVDVPESVQIERLMARDGSDDAQARAILAAQASRQQRLDAADDVITNTDTPEALRTAVEALHQRYLRMAGLESSRPVSDNGANAH
ncbi:MAG: dephospho-CoA kinase [Ectothiorhodospiraceae bacterium]|nr:dephospho-CoA kinase [Ectothiorhodospiraceae bacterium]